MSELAKKLFENAYKCPNCGYTHWDANYNMDHYLCLRDGGPVMPEPTSADRAWITYMEKKTSR